jgi:hypothetical protein
MKRSPALSAGVLTLTALLGIGCAHAPQLLASLGATPLAQLEARGPGTVFASIDDAAVDALTHAFLQARAAGDAERMRGGAIYRTGAGYSYRDPHVAGHLRPHRITHGLRSRDVARFLVYPRVVRHEVNRANERISLTDRRSVDIVDPLHRPVYILHPSLIIRAYHGNDREAREVATLGAPALAQLVVGVRSRAGVN